MRLLSLTLLLSSFCVMQTSYAEGEARFPSSSAPRVNINPPMPQRVGSPPPFERPNHPLPPPPRQIEHRPRFNPPHDHYSRGRDSGWQVRYYTPFPSWAFYYDLTPPSNTTIIYTNTPNTSNANTNNTQNNMAEERANPISPLEKSIVAQWVYRDPSLYNIIPTRKLEPNWQNSLNIGETLSDATFSYAQALPPALMQQMPNAPQGTLLITLQGKLLRVWLRTQTVIDVYDLPSN